MKFVVAGGTGTVGKHVVAVARERGHEAAPVARSTGVDLTTGDGLDDVLAGADVVIDVTSVSTTKAAASVAFFEAVTRALLAAEQRAGVAHHLALSIVGIDRGGEASGYYAGKIAQEHAVAAGGVPWTILRATQFHEFARQMFERGKAGPLVLVPAMRSQPIAARKVAERLVDLAEGAPAGRAADLGGPRVERMAELSRRWGEAAHQPGRVVEIPLPGRFGRQLRDGSLLTEPDADLGVQTFTEWLTDEMGTTPPERRVVPVETGLSLLFGAMRGDAEGENRGGLSALLRRREPAPRLPEPSLTNVEEFVRQLRDSGMRIRLVVEGEPRRVPIAVDEAAFRTLQAEVSIVLMRVRETDATARVRYLPDSVEVAVEHAAPKEARRGEPVVDLVKTRRAVERLGGTVAATATDDGGFRVSAVFPA